MSQNKKRRFALVTGCGFPAGGPGTNRFTTYCKALAHNGCFTKVYITHATEAKGLENNHELSGVYQGIHFKYLTDTLYCDANTRLFARGCSFVKSILRCIRQLKNDRIDTVVLYSYDIKLYLIMWLYTRLNGCILLIDRGEYPSKRSDLNAFRRFKEAYMFKVFDGFIIMSDELISYYSGVKRANAKIFHLPMTVDMERFASVARETQFEKYIACMFGVHNRDGLIDTVKAYRSYSDIVGENAYKLWLIGDIDQLQDDGEVKRYVRENGLGKQVCFLGLIPPARVPYILKNAECLITTAREYISGGFPCKIGEYLATGNLVIATGAGELPVYLTHGSNVLLPAPGDIEDIVASLVYFQNHRDECMGIAENGYKTADRYFNVNSYIEDFFRFCNALNR